MLEAKFLVSELNDRIQELILSGDKVVEIAITEMDADPEFGHPKPFYSMSFTTYDEDGIGIESESIDSLD